MLSVISNNIAAWLLQTLPDKPCSWSIHSCAPSARQAASGVVLYLLCCFSAAVNTQTGSHHAVVAELRPADLRAAQQQARQSPPYIRVYHCDAQAEQKRVSFMEEKRWLSCEMELLLKLSKSSQDGLEERVNAHDNKCTDSFLMEKTEQIQTFHVTNNTEKVNYFLKAKWHTDHFSHCDLFIYCTSTWVKRLPFASWFLR